MDRMLEVVPEYVTLPSFSRSVESEYFMLEHIADNHAGISTTSQESSWAAGMRSRRSSSSTNHKIPERIGAPSLSLFGLGSIMDEQKRRHCLLALLSRLPGWMRDQIGNGHNVHSCVTTRIIPCKEVIVKKALR